jgi:beta-carotene isomerase
MKISVLLSSSLVAVPCASFSTTTSCGKHSIHSSRARLSLDSSASSDIDWATQLTAEAKEIGACASILGSALFQKNSEVDEMTPDPDLFVSRQLELRRRASEIQRYEWLAKLLKTDYDAYVATASFLSPSRIPRMDLPNVQDVPIDKNAIPSDRISDNGVPLVADCELDDMRYEESPLDKILLSTFRKLVTKNTGGVTSDQESIDGLLEQGRTFMLQEGQTPEAQHKMVSDTLGGLMTPVLPPFYRIFMSGIVPKLGTDYDGKQIGPWFYAPFLTSFVTPTFFAFLVGPSKPNRRKDGELGGLVVEKCRFLQESGCKGMCLHQCKLPAQQFFQEELGLPLTVSPNFVTQECQWSFGETPLPPKEDLSFPKGCLVGCESRKAIVAMGSKADACN